MPAGVEEVLESVSQRLTGVPRRELGAGECVRLRDWLALVPDHRRAQGRRYELVSVLGICAAGMLAGVKSVASIARWAADAGEEVLAALGICPHRRSGQVVAPHESTIRRVLRGMDADAFDDSVGGWLAAQLTDPDDAGEGGPTVVAVDGKTIRGAKAADGTAPHLLAAMVTGETAVIAQREVGAKTNEITRFVPLLADLDLDGAVVLADAMHTQRAHATFLVAEKNADYLMIVKENQPRLFDTLNTLPWDQVPIGHTDTDRGHGRRERRTIQVIDAPADLPFPHAAQALLIERYVHHERTGRDSAVAALGITSLDRHRAGPARLAELTRTEWEIENGLHWRRSVT